MYWLSSTVSTTIPTSQKCYVWGRGLTTSLLHVGLPFGNRFLNTSWAVGLTYWIVYLFHFFLYIDICNYICLDTSYHFLALSLLLKYSLFFKYSSTNTFHRRSLCTFYMVMFFGCITDWACLISIMPYEHLQPRIFHDDTAGCATGLYVSVR